MKAMSTRVACAVMLAMSAAADEWCYQGISFGTKADGICRTMTAKGWMRVDGTHFRKNEKTHALFTLADEASPMRGGNVKAVVLLAPVIPDDWDSLLELYGRVRKALGARFGRPETDGSLFVHPYEDGDGYEMQAVRAGKCLYAAIWKAPAESECFAVMAQITESGFVCIVYESREFSAMVDRQRKKQSVDF